MNSWTQEREVIAQQAKSLNKHIVLYTKDNWFCAALAWLLFIISFGVYKREKFLQETATAIAHMHFYPKEWDAAQVRWALPHEAQHTFQNQVMGLGIHPILGLPLSFIVYCFLPLPVGFALGRFYMEADADRLRYKLKINRIVEQIQAGEIEGRFFEAWKQAITRSAEERVNQLADSSYFYAVPRGLAQIHYKKMLKRIFDEAEKKLG